MAILTYLSKHARYRVEHRTRLSDAEIIDILESKYTIDIGTEPASRRMHLLFYSPIDDACFIAVRDSLYGTVSTLLPLEFHAMMAWPVKQVDLDLAKAKAQEYELRPPPITDKLPNTVHIIAFTLPGFEQSFKDGKIKVMKLRVKPGKYSSSQDVIKDLKHLAPDLKSKLEAKAPLSTIDTIMIKLGNGENVLPGWVTPKEIR